MKTAIISPHTDDAIFSLGSFLSSPHEWGDVVVVSPFAGIPGDKPGLRKHTKLRAEHEEACKLAGVWTINGPFFDDVYGKQNEQNVGGWLMTNTFKFDKVYLPLGIHHPDHVFARDICLKMKGMVKIVGFYEELPYRVLYPELYMKAVQEFTIGMRRTTRDHLTEKEKLVNIYDSQVAPHLYPQLFVTEGIWQ